MSKPCVFLYGRVSTDRQDNSKEAQEKRLREYAARRELGDPLLFVDSAISGKVRLDKRPAGGELWGRIRRGDHLVITRIDRAFRSTADCALKVIQVNQMGIRLHILDFGGDLVDCGTPHGKMFLHMLAAFAEYERDLISQRTKEGLANRKDRGARHSRFPGYGFRWETVKVDGKVSKVKVRDDAEREVMAAIVEWRMADGLSWDAIRDRLANTLKLRTKDGGEWDCNRIRRACKAELGLQLEEQRASR